VRSTEAWTAASSATIDVVTADDHVRKLTTDRRARDTIAARPKTRGEISM